MTEERPMGLRERKKLATRAALSWAALRLAAERGLANVLVEDIAAAAGVSPRTFNNYFHSKEEAIVAIGVDRAANTATVLRETPAEVPLWPAVTAAVLSQYDLGIEPDRGFVDQANLVGQEPALRAEWIKAHTLVETKLTEAIAERIGLDAEQDPYPALLAGVVTNAARCAIGFWRQSGTEEPLVPLIKRALAEVARGLPDPR
jgi:AcrR family transcriptional regulator